MYQGTNQLDFLFYRYALYGMCLECKARFISCLATMLLLSKISVNSWIWPKQYMAPLVFRYKYNQGRIEPLEAARGHLYGYLEGKMMVVTKNRLWLSCHNSSL